MVPVRMRAAFRRVPRDGSGQRPPFAVNILSCFCDALCARRGDRRARTKAAAAGPHDSPPRPFRGPPTGRRRPPGGVARAALRAHGPWAGRQREWRAAGRSAPNRSIGTKEFRGGAGAPAGSRHLPLTKFKRRLCTWGNRARRPGPPAVFRRHNLRFQIAIWMRNRVFYLGFYAVVK